MDLMGLVGIEEQAGLRVGGATKAYNYYVDLGFKGSFTIPAEGAVGKINMDPKTLKERLPEKGHLLSLSNGVGSY